MNEVIY